MPMIEASAVPSWLPTGCGAIAAGAAVTGASSREVTTFSGCVVDGAVEVVASVDGGAALVDGDTFLGAAATLLVVALAVAGAFTTGWATGVGRAVTGPPLAWRKSSVTNRPP